MITKGVERENSSTYRKQRALIDARSCGLVELVKGLVLDKEKGENAKSKVSISMQTP